MRRLATPIFWPVSFEESLQLLVEVLAGVNQVNDHELMRFRMLRKFGGQIDLLITDIDMPGDTDGINLADSAKKSFPKLPVLVVSDHIVTSAEGFAVVQKPFASDAILKAIDDTMQRHSAQLETPETSELRSDKASGSARSCDRHPVAKKAAGRKLVDRKISHSPSRDK
jgi:DNA-binding NtrC family response regulator